MVVMQYSTSYSYPRNQYICQFHCLPWHKFGLIQFRGLQCKWYNIVKKLWHLLSTFPHHLVLGCSWLFESLGWSCTSTDKVTQMCQGICHHLKNDNRDQCLHWSHWFLIVKSIYWSWSMDCNTPTQYLKSRKRSFHYHYMMICVRLISLSSCLKNIKKFCIKLITISWGSKWRPQLFWPGNSSKPTDSSHSSLIVITNEKQKQQIFIFNPKMANVGRFAWKWTQMIKLLSKIGVD